MEAQENDRTERLRSVFKRMERSIDDARARRVDAPGRTEAVAPAPAAPAAGGGRMPIDPLDTPIADSKPKPEDFSTGSTTVRDAETMFDFNGPRLKARPKRSNNP